MNEKNEATRFDEMLHEAKMESFRCTIAYGMATMKALFWLSGGAAAFMGYMVVHGCAGSGPLCAFFIAALLASGSMGASYLSQACYTQNDQRGGNAFQRVAMGLTALAFSANIGGVICAGTILSALG